MAAMASDSLDPFVGAEPEPMPVGDAGASGEDIEALYAEIDRLDATVSELTDELSAREERIEALEAELRDKSRAVLAVTPHAQLARLLKQRESDLEAAVNELVSSREEWQRSAREAAQREERLREALVAANQTLSALKSQLAARSIDVATECDRAAAAERELADVRAQLARANDDKRALEQENNALSVQLCAVDERVITDTRASLQVAG